jgi:hypothetical protein
MIGETDFSTQGNVIIVQRSGRMMSFQEIRVDYGPIKRK